jgi:hypothetical protein
MNFSQAGVLHAHEDADEVRGISLTGSDDHSGVLKTQYSLDEGTTWSSYENPIKISAEGIAAIQYYSVDRAGNYESPKTISLKIDKTAPEGKITLDPTTRKLTVFGNDNLSPATVTTTSKSSLITDEAGHTLKISFSKFEQNGLTSNVRVTGLAYDGVAVKNLPIARLPYAWAEKNKIIQTLAERATITRNFRADGIYNAKQNTTYVRVESPVSDSNEDLAPNDKKSQKETLSGLRIFWLSTKKGVMYLGY